MKLWLKGYGVCPWQVTTEQTEKLLKNVPPGSVKQQALFVLGRYHDVVFNSFGSKKTQDDFETLHETISYLRDYINNGKWSALPFYSK